MQRLLFCMSFFGCLVCLSSNYALAQSLSDSNSEQAIIKGFSKWQASRVERLILDEAINDISGNEYVKRFFTQTANNIQLYSGVSSKRLIPLMQYYIKADVEKFRYAVEKCIPANVNGWKANPDRAVDLFTALGKISGRITPEDNYAIQKFIDEVCKEGSLNSNLNLKTEKGDLYLLDAGQVGVSETSESVQYVSQKILSEPEATKIKSILKPLITKREDKDSKNEEPINDSDYVSFLEKFVEIIGEFKSVEGDEEIYSIRIHQMILLIEMFGGESVDFSGYSKLKSISLFFGALADASVSASGDGADAVVAVLDTYVDDRDAFANKRAKSGLLVTALAPEYNVNTKAIEKEKSYRKWFVGRDVLFVSSYFGLSYADVADEIKETHSWDGRAFGPVGIEWKWWSGSNSLISFNYAPFDIGNYVTNELNGDEYDAKFEDIYSPSYFISLTMKQKPLSFLAGYQTGIKYGENFETEGPFIGVTFDLPIFTLY